MPELSGGASIIWKIASFKEGDGGMVTPQVLFLNPCPLRGAHRVIRGGCFLHHGHFPKKANRPRMKNFDRAGMWHLHAYG